MMTYICRGPADILSQAPSPGCMYVPSPKGLPELTGIAAELGLDVELPRVLAGFPGVWVEYGLVEGAYAQRTKGLRRLSGRYGHTAIKASRYTVSSFLSGTLGILSTDGRLLVRPGPATGRWSYNRSISWGPCRQHPTGFVSGRGRAPARQWTMCPGVPSHEAHDQKRWLCVPRGRVSPRITFVPDRRQNA